MASSTVRSVAFRLSVEGGEIAVQKLTTVGDKARKALEPVSPVLRAVSAASEEVQSGLRDMAGEAGAVGSVLSKIGPLGLGIAGTLGTVALAAHEAFSQAREADEYADGIERAAQRLRLGTEAFQEISAAAAKYNIDQAAVETGLSTLRGTVSTFVAGVNAGRGMKQVFAELGISREQLAAAGSFEQQLKLIADALARLPANVREGLAARLGLSDLLPLVQQGSAGLDKLMQAAKAAGLVMDAGVVKAGADANREYEELSDKISVKLKSAFVGLSPVIHTAQNWFADLAGYLAKIVDHLTTIEAKSTDTLQSRWRTDQADLEKLKKELAELEQQGPGQAITAFRVRRNIAAIQADSDRVLAELGKRFGDKMGPYVPTQTGAPPATQQDLDAMEAARKQGEDQARAELDRAAQLNDRRVAYINQLTLADQRAQGSRVAAEDAANVELLRGREGYYKALLKQSADARDSEIAQINAEEKAQIDSLDKLRNDFARNGQSLPDYDESLRRIQDAAANSRAAAAVRFNQEQRSIAQEAQGSIAELVRQINEPLDQALRDVGANGLRDFTDALTDIGTGAANASDAVGRMVTSILADMERLALQRAVTAPLAGALDSAITSLFAGPHATGGGVGGGAIVRVNERGGFPETFLSPQGGGTILSSPASLDNVVQMVSRRLGSQTVIAAQAAPKVEVHYHGDAPPEVSQSYDAASGTTRIDLKQQMRDATAGSIRRGDLDAANLDRYGVKPIPRRRN